jgi:hypothetical protein
VFNFLGNFMNKLLIFCTVFQMLTLQAAGSKIVTYDEAGVQPLYVTVLHIAVHTSYSNPSVHDKFLESLRQQQRAQASLNSLARRSKRYLLSERFVPAVRRINQPAARHVNKKI